MNQTKEEKSERKRIRKKLKRAAAGRVPRTPPEVFSGYRTSPEFRENTRKGALREWDNNRSARMVTLLSPEFTAASLRSALTRWNDPEARERAAKIMLEYYSSEENRRRHSENMKAALDNPEFRAKCSQRVGPLAANWRGGISFEPYCYKFNADFRRNVRHFFNGKCVLCLYEEQETPPQKRLLNVHHVHYDKDSLCNDTSPRMFAPLCDSHHGMTNGDREFWEALLSDIINSVYNGQSYYSEEEWSAIKLKLCLPEVTEISDPQPIEA